MDEDSLKKVLQDMKDVMDRFQEVITGIEECKYCFRKKNVSSCEAREGESNGGMYCTRPKGHEGPHVACGTRNDHELETWEP